MCGQCWGSTAWGVASVGGVLHGVWPWLLGREVLLERTVWERLLAPRVSTNAISGFSLRIFRRQLQHAKSPLRIQRDGNHCSWYNSKIRVYTTRMTHQRVTTKISEVY